MSTSILDKQLQLPRKLVYLMVSCVLVGCSLLGSLLISAKAASVPTFTPYGIGVVAGNGNALPDDKTMSKFEGFAGEIDLTQVADVVADSRGWIYIADQTFGFRMIDPKNRVAKSPIPTPQPSEPVNGVAQPITPETALWSAQSLALAGDDIIFAASHSYIVKYNRLSNKVEAVVGNGAASPERDLENPLTSAFSPGSIALTPDNSTLYFTDTNDGSLYKYDLLSKQLSQIELEVQLHNVRAMTFADDNKLLYIADSKERLLYVYNSITSIVEPALPQESIGSPHDVVFDTTGNMLYVTDIVGRRIFRVNLKTMHPQLVDYQPDSCTQCGVGDLAGTQDPAPYALAISRDTQVLFVGDDSRQRLYSLVIHTPNEVSLTPTTAEELSENTSSDVLTSVPESVSGSITASPSPGVVSSTTISQGSTP